jgi:hypothetical protein
MNKQLKIGSWLLGKALVAAAACTPIHNHGEGFADAVIAYTPGTGFATEFGTGLGFTNAAVALGEPSRITPGQFGGPVDPFNPPYLRDQIVSLGQGGSLTLRLDSPARNDSRNPFGLDFVVFGNSGFIITNGNFSGGGITDGSLFAANEGATHVSVSVDGSSFYQLTPSLSPTVDGLYPTDGLGDFHIPVDLTLKSADFAGKDLAGIRALYDGSGGGTGFDIAWARDNSGNPVVLDAINFVRIDVLSGASEIDAVSIVPEPGVMAILAIGGAVLGIARFFPRRGGE